MITKSRYLKGRQCHKRLWLGDRGFDEPEIESKEVWEERAKEGGEVEDYAERFFPDGVRIGPPPGKSNATKPSWEERFAATQKALVQRAPIFQAHLTAGDLLAIADILEPRGNGWFLWEVKASTYRSDKWKPVFDWDLGFQVHVARAAGLEIVGTGVILLDREFVKGAGPPDPEALLAKVDRTGDVEGHLPALGAELLAMREALAQTTIPDEHPGAHCKANRAGADGRRASACGHIDAEGECGKSLPKYWAGRLPGLRGDKEQYVNEIPNRPVEQLDLEDLDHDWSKHQRWVIEAVKSGEPYVDRDALRAALDELEWPVAYLDFEFDPGIAVPRFEGCRPYDSIPFQWALVVQPEPGAELNEPQAFLHLDSDDPSRAFAESLLEALPGSGSIVAHHASAETTVLKRLAQRLDGGLAARLLELIPRFQDTEAISKAGYYHPDQQGSWSIKKIAPALIGRGYDDLDIADGMAAVVAWRRAVAADGEERERLREDLLRYCGRDAELMHGILEALRALAS